MITAMVLLYIIGVISIIILYKTSVHAKRIGAKRHYIPRIVFILFVIGHMIPLIGPICGMIITISYCFSYIDVNGVEFENVKILQWLFQDMGEKSDDNNQEVGKN